MNASLNAQPAAKTDALSMRRWFLLYGVYMLALAIPTAILLRDLPGNWKDLFIPSERYALPGQQALKLLIFALYISICTTFTPLPTGWLVSALAIADVALSPSLTITTLLVATVGAIASTMANGMDFHLFTWLLRHHRVSKVRETRLYHRTGPWFSRRPFWLLVVFNIIPIPVDVVRMLAAVHQYPFRPFLAANFIGRWIRYAVIAAVTFLMGAGGWAVSAALLGVAVILGIFKVVHSLLNRRRGDSGGATIG